MANQTTAAAVTVEEKDGVITIKHGTTEIALSANNNDVTVRADGKVLHEQVVPTVPVAAKPLEVGDLAEDGSIYAGIVNGFKVFAAPLDLTNTNAQHLTLTFNNASKKVQELNAGNYLGHNDWKMPEMEVMHRIRESRDKGAFKDSFKGRAKLTSADYPHFYWTSTHHSKYDQVIQLPLNVNETHWENIYSCNRLSTRAVRLEKA